MVWAIMHRPSVCYQSRPTALNLTRMSSGGRAQIDQRMHRAEFGLAFTMARMESPACLMRLIFTWLMIVCALTGLNARVLGADLSQLVGCSHLAEPCCQDDHHGATVPADPHGHGDECPPEKHHHHSCGCSSHAMPLSVESDLISRLGIPEPSLLGVRHEGDVPPEGPFLGSEKPPLI
jgi:hypothetical protein